MSLHHRKLLSLVARVPPWTVVLGTVLVSVALSVLALLVLGWANRLDYGDRFGQILAIAVAVPVVVATPVSGVIVSLVVALRNEHERVLRLEQSDALTGLPNRRAFFDLALRALAMAQRNHQPWAVAVLDLDDFKTVNDRHGHAVGDQLLAGAAQACLGAVRASDVVARWGGEEIVLLLVGAGPRDAAAVLERTRAAIQQRTVHVDGGGEVRRTASIGVALGDHLSQAPVSQAWLETFIARADAAMYRAKRSGKNRVVFWNAADRETEREVDRAAN